MELLNIITRCTRLGNLKKISESIFSTDKFTIKWFIIFDTNSVHNIPIDLLLHLQSKNVIIKYEKSEPNDHGHQMVNNVIDEIESGWVYVLDDDNIIHHDFFNSILDIITDNKKIEGIIFDQKIGGVDFTKQDLRLSSPDDVKVGKIDMAQFLLKRDLIGISRIPRGHYVGDGMFIEKLFNENTEKFIFINKVLCYYNYFQQNKQPNKRTLPRVLIIGDDEKRELKSNFYADYESTELFNLHKLDDNELDVELNNFDPDCIITIGENFDKFPNLCQKSLDFRKRWLHTEKVSDVLGESAYLCSTNFILDQHCKTNPLISFFTPIYNTGKKLLRTFESVKNQTYQNWEWVLVNDSNDDGLTLKIAEEISNLDARVKVYDFHKKTGGIVGESKYRAASLCNGIYLMELDHDDYITPDASALMVEAFQKYPDCKFVYSDFAEIDENHNSLTYGDSFSFNYGSYRDEKFAGINYKTVNTSNINPKTIRHIVGVPNHFRAWDRFFYHSIGGHNRRLSIADDYELIVRTFLKTKMVRIPKLLYLQFYHNSNTQNATRSDIQRRVRSISSYYNEKIKERFEELGQFDWAYDYNPNNPLLCPSKFGTHEGYVNLTMSLQNEEFSYDWSSLMSN
jgi:glycosyltransferase involved in cell wall biosynthesis